MENPPHADALLRLLQGKPKNQAGRPEAAAVGAWDWGVMLVARHFWQQLGVEEIIDSLAKHRGLGQELADRALALVSNRLCEPSSEHVMARWLETDFVCDRWGQRWLPAWREESERLSSPRPRVRVFVGDRGMVTSGNLDWLRAQEQGYLVGLKRRRQPEILRYLEGATGPWLECPAGISASEKYPVPKTLVQEVASGKAGVRVFVVHSEERLEYERGEREKAMLKVQEELEALQQ